MHSHFCRHCDRDVTPRRAVPVWAPRIALVLTSLGGVAAVLAASLIGPFIMFAVPLMALYGFALGPLHWLATLPEVCGHCQREVVYRTRADARAAMATRRAATPSIRAAA